MNIEEVTKLDYEFLTGTWEGPGGAALNSVYEDCKDSGWGGYGQPTEKGKAAIEYYERCKKDE